MRWITISVIILTKLLYIGSLFSQCDSIQYSSNFEFTDGIYLTFEEFKKNDPSIKKKAIITNDPTDQFFVGNIVNHEKIAYYEANGDFKKLKRREVWGYCSNGTVYIRLGQHFNRIFKIGSICHFVAEFNTIIYNRNLPVTSSNKPIRFDPYMIDLETANILSYDLENFLILLKRDEKLYIEFTSIKGYRKKKQQMFNYLNKFNERNPFYIQVR